MNAIIFDAYGTLFNLDALPDMAAKIVGDRKVAKHVCDVWRQKQLEYAWRSVLMQRYQDFDKLTEAAARYALVETGTTYDDSAVQALMEAYLRLPLYDDVLPVLEKLEGKYKLAILSNGTLRSLQTLANHSGILFSLDYLLSVEPIRKYKPAREPYQLALDTLKCDKQQVNFVSSNHWDAVGATSFGFNTFWCDRLGTVPDKLGPSPHRTISGLDQLPSYLESINAL